MTSLYNCKHSGDQYRITKFTSDFNVEASYLCDETACECPAGHRPSCRHRSMLPKFIQRDYVGKNWFFDYDRGGWVQGWKEEPAEVLEEQLVASAALLSTQEPEPSQYPCTEENCFGHVASKNDPKVCGLCGTHIDSLRPDEEPSLTIATEITLLADATPDEVAEAFGNLLASKPSPITIEDLDKVQFGKILHQRPHSQMATTTDFDSIGDGSSPSVAAKGTIRRRV